MKVAFLIQRRNYYRLLGPVVERALARPVKQETRARNPGQPTRELRN